MIKKVGLGIIGCGVMGSELARQAQAIDFAEILAVCDTNEEAAQRLAAELQVEYFVDYQKLLQIKSLRAAVIATPPNSHSDIAITCANYKKHIFCEKPMAITIKDCDAMITAAKRNKVKLMIGQILRFYPIHSKVKELVDSGVIGEPTCIVIYRLGGGYRGTVAREWRTRKSGCGGLLMETNSHELDFMRWVCGEVKSVYAVGKNFVSSQLQDYPDIALLLMEFANGSIGCLHSSQASFIGGYGGRIDGKEGSISFPAFWGEDASITYLRAADAGGEPMAIRKSELTTESPVKLELKAFLEAIVEDKEPPVSGEDGRAAIELAEAAYLSMELGKPVELPLL